MALAIAGLCIAFLIGLCIGFVVGGLAAEELPPTRHDRPFI